MNKIKEKFKKTAHKATIISAFIGALASIIAALLGLFFTDQPKYMDYMVEKDIMSLELTEQIEIITANLENTTTYLDSIQRELYDRTQQANNLKKEIEDAQSFLELNENEVSAVKNLINAEINRNSTKDFWISFAMSFLFFILGAVTSHLMPIVIRKFSKKTT